MTDFEIALAVQEQRVRRLLLQHTIRPFVPRPVTPTSDRWPDPDHEGNHKWNKYKCPCTSCREQRRAYERNRRELARKRRAARREGLAA